mgnify:CR=1 FL=1
MSSSRTINEEDSLIQDQNIKEFLTPELCEDAGIIVTDITENSLDLGAMNLSYIKVKKIINTIEDKFNLKVSLKQITSLEWETWFENTHAVSVQTIQKNSTITPQDNTLQFKEEANNDLENDYQGLKTTNNDGINFDNDLYEEDDDELIDDANDEALIRLAQANIGDDSEMDNDILFGEELTASTDPVISGVASILSKCFTLKGSDIHAEPLEDRLRIRYRIDGVLKEAFAFPKSHVNPIISRIKIMSKLDISEKRLPQDGRIRCLLRGRRSDFRVSTLPGRWGEKVVLRALESDNSVLNLSNLITERKELDMINNMSKSPYGIVIVVGPTGSGKSTTLYSMLSALNKPGVNISTVEDPVEYTLDGIHQVQVIREKGLDFSRALRSLMRQDPDIILVGETRDKETAQAAMEAALTGHMVFTTLHANDTATAITRLAEMEIPPYLIGASIIGVVAQRLVRKVCKGCSELRKLNSKEHKLAVALGVEKARFLSKSNKNCSICNGTGYKGRVGIYEVMKVNEIIRELIMNQANADEIRERAFDKSGRTLLSYGMKLVKEELTTIEEVERVCLLSETQSEEL